MIFHSVAAPVVALNVFYQAGPGADCESMTSVLIVRKESTKETIRLLETLDCRESLPQLYTHHGRARAIARCDWDDLVLDRSIVSLLKNDFESFWKREQWFHDRHLPFRRGYLLHGPPGNGKSTAIRAMMCSRGLSAFTIRLFDPQTSDVDLDELFEEALTERPRVRTAPGKTLSRSTRSPVVTAASARVVGTPSADMASLTMYSRKTGPSAALPSPPRENGVGPEPLSWMS
jgi:hypothetical protein